MTLAPELVLAGRYRLVERIAAGGMGEVWRAVDTILGRQVAVKALKAELADDPEFLSRFRAEARHTASLLHPGIANVYDYGEVGDGQGRSGATTAYLVMELVDGEPLSTILARERRLDPARALDLCGQAAFALQAAHDLGVVHRDVKPGNLLVRQDGVVKVTDFGIARAVDAAPTTATGTVLGTAYYLSPEQAGGGGVGPPSDVYSLGVVAFECLSGRRPYGGDTAIAVALAHQREPVPELPGDVPEPVRRLVAQALAKDPADRPASAGQFGRDLLAVRDAVYGGASPDATVVLPPAVARASTDSTRVLPPLPPARPTATPPPQRREPRNESPARASTARSAAPLVLGIILALVVAGALLVRNLGGGDPVEPVPVPDVVGEPLDAATARLEQAGLDADVRRTEARDAEPGTVLAQDPAAGEQAEPGSEVRLDVAEEPAGPETVTVDPGDYRGRPFEDVRAALQDLGLRVRRTNTGSGQEPGLVSDVDPSGDVEVGSVVTVFVVPEDESSPSASPSPAPAPTSGSGTGGDTAGDGQSGDSGSAEDAETDSGDQDGEGDSQGRGRSEQGRGSARGGGGA